MNLVAQAEADLSFTLEDIDNGFGLALQFKDTSGDFQTVNCQSTDIGFFVDPSTGAAVAGRQVEVTSRITTFGTLNIPYPTKNTFVKYITTKGDQSNMKVQQVRPDRKLGIYNLVLEVLKNG